MLKEKRITKYSSILSKVALSVALFIVCFVTFKLDSYAYYDTDGAVYVYGVTADTDVWLNIKLDHMEPGTGNYNPTFVNTLVGSYNLVDGQRVGWNTAFVDSSTNWIKKGVAIKASGNKTVSSNGGSIVVTKHNQNNGTYPNKDQFDLKITFNNVDTLGATPYLYIDNSNSRPGYTVNWSVPNTKNIGGLTTGNSTGGIVQSNTDVRMTKEDIYLGSTSSFRNITMSYVANKYNVHYYINGIRVENQPCTYGVSAKAKELTPKTGYKYSYHLWSRNGHSNQGTITPGAYFSNLTTVNGENLTYMINQTPITYKIRYNPNCSEYENSMSDQVCTYDKEFTLSDNGFVRDGYSFEGWVDRDGNYLSGNLKNLTTKDGDVIDVYAKWSLREGKLTFEAYNDNDYSDYTDITRFGTSSNHTYPLGIAEKRNLFDSTNQPILLSSYVKNSNDYEVKYNTRNGMFDNVAKKIPLNSDTAMADTFFSDSDGKYRQIGWDIHNNAGSLKYRIVDYAHVPDSDKSLVKLGTYEVDGKSLPYRYKVYSYDDIRIAKEKELETMEDFKITLTSDWKVYALWGLNPKLLRFCIDKPSFASGEISIAKELSDIDCHAVASSSVSYDNTDSDVSLEYLPSEGSTIRKYTVPSLFHLTGWHYDTYTGNAYREIMTVGEKMEMSSMEDTMVYADLYPNALTLKYNPNGGSGTAMPDTG